MWCCSSVGCAFPKQYHLLSSEAIACLRQLPAAGIQQCQTPIWTSRCQQEASGRAEARVTGQWWQQQPGDSAYKTVH